MYKDQVFAIGIIVLLAALCFFIWQENVVYKNFTRVIVDEWVVREQELVDLCQIDYNQALIDKRDKLIEDLNFKINEKFGVGG